MGIEMSDDPRIAVIGPAIARHRLRSMSQVHLAAVIRLARNAVTIAVKLWAIPRLGALPRPFPTLQCHDSVTLPNRRLSRGNTC